MNGVTNRMGRYEGEVIQLLSNLGATLLGGETVGGGEKGGGRKPREEEEEEEESSVLPSYISPSSPHLHTIEPR